MAIETKKLVIIGSGLHQHILGCCPSPLADWATLLTSLAKKHRVRLSAVDLDSPTATWEQIITEVSRRSKKSVHKKHAAYEIEAELRNSIVEILEKEQERYADLYAESGIVNKIPQNPKTPKPQNPVQNK
jgi:hypothetical protein